jgi:lactate permease
MAATQYLLATNGLWNLAGFVAGMAGLAASALVTRIPLYEQQTSEAGMPKLDSQGMGLWIAIAPYLVLIVVVAAAELWDPLHTLLNQLQTNVFFPDAVTGLGWRTAERTGRRISLFGHAGALLAYTSVAACLIYMVAGHMRVKDIPVVFKRTVRSAVPSSLGIVSMVGMAMIMARCGMTHILAKGLSETVGSIFPFMSPFIGLLGAFMTGSNTNSNVVFASLQKTTAQLVGVSVLLILGAQTTGGSLGSMLAPAKVIVGCSTAGLEGEEGKVMRITLVYGLVITALIGAIVWVVTTLR